MFFSSVPGSVSTWLKKRLPESGVMPFKLVQDCSETDSYPNSYYHPNRIFTNRGVIEANSIVLACNGYLGKLERRVSAKIMPINNFIIATEPLTDPLSKEINPRDVTIADSRFVVNYYHLSADKRLLFGGGENYRRNFPGDIANFVRKPMLQVYPQLAETRVDFAWGGTLAVTLNRMPDFGRLGKYNT